VFPVFIVDHQPTISPLRMAASPSAPRIEPNPLTIAALDWRGLPGPAGEGVPESRAGAGLSLDRGVQAVRARAWRGFFLYRAGVEGMAAVTILPFRGTGMSQIRRSPAGGGDRGQSLTVHCRPCAFFRVNPHLEVTFLGGERSAGQTLE